MEWLHSKKSFRPDMMKEEPAAALINETYRVLDSAVKSKLKKSVPQELTDHLERDTYYFSGFKTFHELREASALLKGDDGGFKPFDKFLKDVEKIDNTYNKSYLYAEYNFAVQSTQMAVKWKEWEKDGDDYDLQFRTSEDDRVRPEHAALDGTTLPFSDEFWNKYIPPLGWNCRCTTVQVLKGKYPRAESWRAQQLGEAATSGTGEKIFRFNPGKQETVFPPKHPYLPKNTQCAGCDRNRRSTLNYNPASESCRTCNAISTCLTRFGKRNEKPPMANEYKEERPNTFVSQLHGKEEKKENLRLGSLIAKHIDSDVFLLPKIVSDTKEGIELRKKLLPEGVKDNKNPDFLIRGKLFEAKSMLAYEGKMEFEPFKKAFINHIKKAKNQADNVIIEVPDGTPIRFIKDAIYAYSNVSKRQRHIWVVKGQNLLTYNTKGQP